MGRLTWERDGTRALGRSGLFFPDRYPEWGSSVAFKGDLGCRGDNPAWATEKLVGGLQTPERQTGSGKVNF